MKKSALWKFSITTAPEAEEAVADLLERHFGGPASTWTDLETGTSTVSVWRGHKPGRMNPGRAELAAGMARIRACGLDAGPGTISLTRTPAQDWAESWKRHFKPMAFGSRLLIQPSWSRRRPAKGQALVVLDPGLSFGTGQHPTTAFCLRELVAHRRPGASQSLLDLGTGSGILAIAAAKLGYAPIQAIDYDADALEIARANARRNRVADRIDFRLEDIARLPRRGAPRHSVVCANLVANLLLSERQRLAAHLEPGGLLLLAGILASEFDAVRDAYEGARLRLASSRTDAEWRAGAFRSRRAGPYIWHFRRSPKKL
jgi:ribosomal protein L11 methyltransferase